jgi:hypothetical protein
MGTSIGNGNGKGNLGRVTMGGEEVRTQSFG